MAHRAGSHSGLEGGFDIVAQQLRIRDSPLVHRCHQRHLVDVAYEIDRQCLQVIEVIKVSSHDYEVRISIIRRWSMQPTRWYTRMPYPARGCLGDFSQIDMESENRDCTYGVRVRLSIPEGTRRCQKRHSSTGGQSSWALRTIRSRSST